MIRVEVASLVINSQSPSSLLVLRPKDHQDHHDKILPILIGSAEAIAIGQAIEGSSSARPKTHELTAQILQSIGFEINQVNIVDVQGTTFFAELELMRNKERVIVDARPSDSIALAARSKAPVFVDEDVLNIAGFPMAGSSKSQLDLMEVEEFKKFLETVTPDDFSSHNKDNLL